jgi:hypothetical protein
MDTSLKGHGNESDFFYFLVYKSARSLVKRNNSEKRCNVLSQIVHLNVGKRVHLGHLAVSPLCGSRFSIMNIFANSKQKNGKVNGRNFCRTHVCKISKNRSRCHVPSRKG